METAQEKLSTTIAVLFAAVESLGAKKLTQECFRTWLVSEFSFAFHQSILSSRSKLSAGKMQMGILPSIAVGRWSVNVLSWLQRIAGGIQDLKGAMKNESQKYILSIFFT